MSLGHAAARRTLLTLVSEFVARHGVRALLTCLTVLALVAPICDWLDQTPSRVPLTDWYWTTDGKQAGFQARSVVGGVFIKMLSDSAMWKKWSSRTN